MALLEVGSVSKSFAGTPVLRDVSFEASEGEVVCLLGPSGCGKTTLLRIIAGLEASDSGRISFGGRSLEGVPIHRRSFGLMFQDFALFPHKDVAANVAFGLRMKDLSGQEVKDRVSEMLALVGMHGYEERRVYDLSGGEQQRVALARSLAPGPRLLMLDEPLGSLDRALREELMNELRTILKGVAVTSVYVTHDQQEAFAVSDRVIVMRQGHVMQQGTPHDVYFRPASPWVARFLGLTNQIPGRTVATHSGPGEETTAIVRTFLGELVLRGPERYAADQEVTVLIRPEAASLAGEHPAEGQCVVEGILRECSFRGSRTRLRVGFSDGVEMAFELASGGLELPHRGESIALVLQPEAMSLLADGAT
jgi:ABC-type Fe3+/spermidine/putrescine transport system ATPase subunit